MSQIFESTDYELNSVGLISSTGQSIEIKFMVQDLNIYEDIFSNCVSGVMQIKDAQNLIEAFQIHGNEYVYIKFRTSGLDSFEGYFRVYKIANVRLNTFNSYLYDLYFCNDDFVINQQVMLSKSYKNVTPTEIVKQILLNELKVDPKRVNERNLEKTINPQNIIIPMKSPMEAINWLSTFSINDELSSGFLFFETREGYNFKSITSLYKNAPYKTLTVNPKNVIEDVDKKIANRFSIDRFEVKQHFDSAETMSSGGYSSILTALDIQSRQKFEMPFNPVDNNTKKLNEFLPFNDATNRLGLSLIQGTGMIRYHTVFQKTLDDKWLLQRAALIALINSFRMSIQTSGDSQLTVGDLLEIDVPSIKPVTESSEVESDKMKSGKFLVTQVRHRIFQNKYINYIEVCKDSNTEGISPFASNKLYETASHS